MAERFCADCGQSVTALALSCPGCHRLTHADRLEQLTREAQACEAADPGKALLLWREALTLLPPESKQAAFVHSRITDLQTKARDHAAKPAEKPAWIKAMGPFAAIGVAAWKFKTIILLALTKGKFLLLGLGKLNTLFSMLASIGLYWTLYGWRFALGFIGGIYVHEMGHVWALRKFGLRASAPMFIPGFGAFVSLYDSPPNVQDDARIGLAGPLWGAAAGIACWVMGSLTGGEIWLAVARATAFINLFNLVPVWQLDGGRGFRALAFPQRLGIGLLMLTLWIATGEGLFFILSLGAAFRIFWQKDHAPYPGDQATLLQFIALLAVFGAMLALIPLPR